MAKTTIISIQFNKASTSGHLTEFLTSHNMCEHKYSVNVFRNKGNVSEAQSIFFEIKLLHLCLRQLINYNPKIYPNYSFNPICLTRVYHKFAHVYHSSRKNGKGTRELRYHVHKYERMNYT